jgi:Sulfotransferase domain
LIGDGDLRSVNGLRLPNLLIAGVPKAGTTSLFWYLSQHPDICASRVKEPRYFWYPEKGELAQPPLDRYARCFGHCESERYVMEASPQYFKGGTRTIASVKETLGDPRIILMLRDPIERLYSAYRAIKSKMRLPKSINFDAYVAACQRVRDEHQPRTRENRPYYALASGFYIDYANVWLDAFGEDIRIWFFEDLVADPLYLVADICRWLGIDEQVVQSFRFSVENKSVMYRSGALQRLALGANSDRLFRNRRRLKMPLRRIYYAINRAPNQEEISDETKRRLQETFAESNVALAKELRRREYQRMPSWLGDDSVHVSAGAERPAEGEGSLGVDDRDPAGSG